MPRRGTRAYFIVMLEGHARRALQRVILAVEEVANESRADFERQLGAFRTQLEWLRGDLPSDVVLTLDVSGTFDDDPLTVNLDFAAVSTEELALAVARITRARPGRPKGQRRPLGNTELLEEIDAAIAAGEGSIRSVSERIAKGAGVPAETLRKQYRRYRRQVVS